MWDTLTSSFQSAFLEENTSRYSVTTATATVGVWTEMDSTQESMAAVVESIVTSKVR